MDSSQGAPQQTLQNPTSIPPQPGPVNTQKPLPNQNNPKEAKKKEQFVDTAIESKKVHNVGNRIRKYDSNWKTRHRIYLQLMKDKFHMTMYDKDILKYVNKVILSIEHNIFEEVIGPLQGIIPENTTENFVNKELFMKAILTKLLESKKKTIFEKLKNEEEEVLVKKNSNIGGIAGVYSNRLAYNVQVNDNTNGDNNNTKDNENKENINKSG